ncbi:hypothetical protein M4D52_05375 [Paenibacillus lactis]|uniref:hypothetical protein n=1 Tax=Paenibacillus lactis TaxID=228574 RepID=UPI00203A9B6F|nr:hypothetical protein [Paenibacillus lactis]MCM3492871.1 hypothetical protein [Paenibacillus lactis]
MPNKKGWYTKEEVLETGLPYFIPSSKRWTDTPYPFAVLLTKSRCDELGIPILASGREMPSAFRYLALAGRGTNEDKRYRYAPLYDRTDAYHLIKDQLYPHEIMGDPDNE